MSNYLPGYVAGLLVELDYATAAGQPTAEIVAELTKAGVIVGTTQTAAPKVRKSKPS